MYNGSRHTVAQVASDAGVGNFRCQCWHASVKSRAGLRADLSPGGYGAGRANLIWNSGFSDFRQKVCW
ncbi:MAG TPA: hypothetical protein DC058_19475 [Planctomycetaceae bacterium]|nr:hypothetical protein [Planctomycetaceae bacterium]HBC63379.1 hypothetical protein [Planctomycetaceae bacterium]